MTALTPNDRMRAEREIVRIVSGVLRAHGIGGAWLTETTEAVTGALLDQYLEPVIGDLSVIIHELYGERQGEL